VTHVSVVINNYNYGRFLNQAIDSALGQTHPKLEIVVVDDGSTDDSREILASYGDRIRSVLKPNGGQASAFNAGYAASNGELVCWLDADDVFLPEKVRTVENVLVAHPSAEWCFHTVRYFRGESGQAIGSPPPAATAPRRVDLRRRMERGTVDWEAPPTSGLCFRRSLLDRILPMPEKEGVTLHDNFQKFAAMALAEGVYVESDLSLQRLHGANAYTLREDRERLKARVEVLTALCLRERIPEIARFTDKRYAFGLALYARSGGIQKDDLEVVRTYWSAVPLARRAGVVLRALYHLLASAWRRVRGAQAMSLRAARKARRNSSGR
jgi:glycosyltransferase involved in cell wall biosynthesis